MASGEGSCRGALCLDGLDFFRPFGEKRAESRAFQVGTDTSISARYEAGSSSDFSEGNSSNVDLSE